MAAPQSIAPHRNDESRIGDSDEAAEKRLRRIAWLLDNSIPLPGGYRIGVDGLIGLVPGIGDAAGALVASYIVVEAGRLGASKALLLRMSFNVLLETLVGAIPFAGDLFDFVYKANMRNLRLLEQHARDPVGQRTSNRTVAAAIIVGVLVIVGAVIWGIAALLGALAGAVSS
ncbi:MAG TPA: DUF4112 domain-containing protein [Woeseiaceae bacterium]|nr:DUF4112 domain-containing protein [Woeseiaceae bacterium]